MLLRSKSFLFKFCCLLLLLGGLQAESARRERPQAEVDIKLSDGSLTQFGEKIKELKFSKSGSQSQLLNDELEKSKTEALESIDIYQFSGFRELAMSLTDSQMYVAMSRLTLEQAKVLVLKSSSRLDMMHTRLRATKKGRSIARARYFPSLSFSSGYRDHRRVAKTSTFFEPLPFEVYDWSLTGEWVVFDGLRRESDLGIQNENVKQSEGLLSQTRRDLLLLTVDYYHRGVYILKQLDLAYQNLKFEKENFAFAQKRAERGFLSKTDLALIEQNVLSAESRIVEQETAWKILMHQLAALFSLKVEKLAGLRELEFNPLKAIQPGNLEQWVQKGLSHREELSLLKSKVRSMKYAQRSSLSQNLPSVQVFYDLSNTNRDQWSSNRDGEAVTVGLGLQWKLFDGLKDVHGYQRDRLERMALEKELTIEEDRIRAEISAKYEELVRERKLKSKYLALRNLSKVTRQNAQKEFKAGRIDVLKLKEVQNQYDIAQSLYLESEVNLAKVWEELLVLCSDVSRLPWLTKQ